MNSEKRIWVDADSCPQKIRDIIVSGAERKGAVLYFVANRKIPFRKSSCVRMIITTNSDADSYILNKVKPEELVITRDIPLAAKLLEKQAIVINDRGTAFTKDNIKEKLSIRNFSYELRNNGYKVNESVNYSLKDVRLFSSEFDKALNKFYTQKS